MPDHLGHAVCGITCETNFMFFLLSYGQGVILGTEVTPMKNVVFDGVRVINAQDETLASYLKCEGVQDAVATGDTYPVPPCFQDKTNSNL